MEDQQQDIESLPEFLTPRGNTLTMELGGPFGFYTLKYKEGGELPDVIKGSYTSISKAVTDIENYIKTIAPIRPKGEPAKIKSEAYTKATATKARKKQEVKEVGENLSS